MLIVIYTMWDERSLTRRLPDLICNLYSPKSMDLKIDIKMDLDELDITEVKKIGFFNAGRELWSNARERAPYQSWTLKKSIGLHPRVPTWREKQVRIGPRKVVYAKIQELGWIIRPKTKKMLAWKKDGKWHFAKQVRIKPTYYMRDTWQKDGGKSIDRAFWEALDIVIRKI